MKRMAKVGRLAEAKRIGDVVHRHLRVAQILDRHFGPQLIENLPERHSFLAQFPAERPFRGAQVRRDVLQAHVPSELGEQETADLARDPDPMREPVVKVFAKREHRGVGDFVAELGSPVQPGRIEHQPVRRLPKGDRAPEVFFVLRLRSGRIERDLQRSGMERRSHHVAVKRDVDAELEFDNEAVEARVDRRMRERIDRPNRPTRLVGEAQLDHWRRKLMVADDELHGLAKVHAAEDGEAVHAVRRDMRPQARQEGEVPTEADCVLIRRDDLRDGHEHCWRPQLVRRDRGSSQPGGGRDALRREAFHDHGDFRRRVDSFLPTDIDHCSIFCGFAPDAN